MGTDFLEKLYSIKKKYFLTKIPKFQGKFDKKGVNEIQN